MKENADNWQFFMDVDFENAPAGSIFNLDTRDFQVYKLQEGEKSTASINAPLQQQTPSKDIRPLLKRFFEQSGGKVRYRHFRLLGHTEMVGWDLKVLRLYKFETGYVICDRYQTILSPTVLIMPAFQS